MKLELPSLSPLCAKGYQKFYFEIAPTVPISAARAIKKVLTSVPIRRRAQSILDLNLIMASREALRQQQAYKDLIKGFKIRQITSELEAGSMDPNAWIRLGEESNEEEATPLMILARIPATAAEKKDSVTCFSSDLMRKKTMDLNDPNINEAITRVGKDRVRLAKLFMKHGGDVNLRDTKGRTALIWACITGLNDLVSCFLHQVSPSNQIPDMNMNDN